MRNHKKRKMIGYAFIGSLLSLTSMVGTQAFLVRGSDKLINRITPGNVAVVLTEPHWEPEKGEHLMPGEIVAKDPMVKNRGSLDAWMFVRVSVPKGNIICVDPVSHRKTEKKKTELLKFQSKDSWELMERKEEDEVTEYIYGYKKMLASQAVTESLFDRIQIVNYLEGELAPEEKIELPIEAYAVQGSVANGENALSEAFVYAFGGDA